MLEIIKYFAECVGMTVILLLITFVILALIGEIFGGNKK